jgi:release factor glutamine methyltransferase
VRASIPWWDRLSLAPMVRFDDVELRIFRDVYPPRPTSLQLALIAVEALKAVPHPIIIDIGCGSGAIGLAIGKRCSGAAVIGVDVSARAVRCARYNARRLRIPNVQATCGHLLQPIPASLRGGVAGIVASLPYLSQEQMRQWRWDVPIETVEGTGVDGLGLLRELAREARYLLSPGGFLTLQLPDDDWSDYRNHLVGEGWKADVPTDRRLQKALLATFRTE